MEPQVTMTGRVGHNPELRLTRNGVEFTRFRIAHTPRLQRDGDWVDGETSWVTVLCYRDLAANVCRSVRRGDPVVVAGRVRVETWQDEATKALRENVSIDARTVGHDLALGATTFMRVRHDKPGEDDRGDAGGAGDGGANAGLVVDDDGVVSDRGSAGADDATADDRTVPDSLAELVEEAAV